MRFIKSTLVASAAGILLVALAAGCSSAFSRRVANSIEACINVQNASKTDLFMFWQTDKKLYLLQMATQAIKTNGIIAYAVISTLNKERHKSLDLGYLSNNASVREIAVVKGGDIILSIPPPTRPYAKRIEKYVVSFGERLIWRTPANPFEGHNAEDLSVSLVKNDGNVIGPVRILSDKAVWEEIRAKMFAEKKWQDKFPWLYDRLLKDTDMKPLWWDPEKARAE